MSEQLIVISILYGPGTLGLVILLLVCVFARCWPAFIFGVIASIVLQTISLAFIFGLVGIGSWGNSSALDIPLRTLHWAGGFTGLLVCGKTVRMAFTQKQARESQNLEKPDN